MATSDASDFPLSLQTLAQLSRVVAKFDPGSLKRGKALFRDGAVRSLEMNEEPWGVAVEAMVRGGSMYHVSIHIEMREGKERASFECSCPVEVDCKHCVAAALTLIEEGEEKLIAQAQKALLATPKTEAKVKSKDEKVATESAAPEPEGGLVGDIQTLLSQKLPAQARRFVKQVEMWWQAQAASLSHRDIASAAGNANLGYWTQVQLYPRELKPKTVLEYLFCLELAMRASHPMLQLPPPLERVIDPSFGKRFKEQWAELRQVAEWKNILSHWTTNATATLGNDGQEPAVLRLRFSSGGAQVECRKAGEEEFKPAKNNYLTQLVRQRDQSGLGVASQLVLSAAVEVYGQSARAEISPHSHVFTDAVSKLLNVPAFHEHLIAHHGEPLEIPSAPLQWRLIEPGRAGDPYQLTLVDEDGQAVPPPTLITHGRPRYYVTSTAAYRLTSWPLSSLGQQAPTLPMCIPARALETTEGVRALDALGLLPPARMGLEVRTVQTQIQVKCRLHVYPGGKAEYFQMCAWADSQGHDPVRSWCAEDWLLVNTRVVPAKMPDKAIIRVDRSPLTRAAEWLQQWRLRIAMNRGNVVEQAWNEMRTNSKDFPTEFRQWLQARPAGVEVSLDSELASLSEAAPVAGSLRLDVQGAGEDGAMDWFDLKVELDVSDLTLSKEEIDLLMKSAGKWVRLPGKGWRRMELLLSEEQQRELADMGLAAMDFDGTPQRVHALQLAGKGEKLLPAESAAIVRRRVEEIQTRVAPAMPANITATLRPYQLSGFHFLAYLSANRFGGVLADDMGLGKTVQTLTWVAWLREAGLVKETILVICPKSVQDNWRHEAAQFYAPLRVAAWTRDSAGSQGLQGDADLLVIHYQQLRQHEDALLSRNWGAVILDEAQAIKNPGSQTAQIACRLRATHRLALTGTPIENRLMDLWSILAFAMPGALGSRAYFGKHFDNRADPLARRRLSARVRPFLLRRTKGEVATDLPERIEEDLAVELEGVQQKLYAAELKRARAQLLKAQTSKELDKMRFNILTSLLRLRQICCHPRLVGQDDKKAESAKLTALMEQLEPLMEEGQKVLVFSQFVEMIEIMEDSVKELSWPVYKLTGSTDNRGDLVKAFNEHAGCAIFLISLKAGGFGLNLTAASYVVLYDPWWNPAVEAQAIDRTHRIGQKQTVIAYRLIVKDSIEEKIRQLQKQKGALAHDILGEENFAQALTLSDFQFLLGGGEGEA